MRVRSNPPVEAGGCEGGPLSLTTSAAAELAQIVFSSANIQRNAATITAAAETVSSGAFATREVARQG